ncbi:MAG: MFS transporter [Thermodesulfobacteriota bacterium]
MEANIAKPINKKSIIAGCIGNVLEWYDFAIYGFFAPVIAGLFFPSEDKLASLISTFGVFAIGYLMRPIGSVIFGILGDKLGRKRALEISVIMMAIPTTLVGVLPTYSHIGVVAPLLLTLLRLFQGVSVGGEFTGSISFVVEHAPKNRRGFYSSWTIFSLLGGILLGSAIASLITNILPKEAVDDWGWRIAFLLGIALGLFGLYLRIGLEEPPEFKMLKESGGLSKTPIREAFRNYWREILTVTGATVVAAVNFYLIFVYMTTYLSTETHVLLSSALDINTISMLVMMILVPFMGHISDKVGRKPLLIIGCLIIMIFSYPLFIVLSKGHVIYDFGAQLVFALAFATLIGGFGAMMVELFPTRIRMSAVSIGYNVGFAIFGGTAPLVATLLIKITDNKLAPSYYLILAGLISLIVFIKIRESYRDTLK